MNSTLVNRCGKCQACLNVERSRQSILKALTIAQSKGKTVGDDARIIWNDVLAANPCEQVKQ